ncbi:MAG: hypothetical protein EOO52_12955 [Gammaproteobacteria bacterium]|nr:MAG: hypothetical protein EOO52_12955 [Gammaproteobacteria bacterium]
MKTNVTDFASWKVRSDLINFAIKHGMKVDAKELQGVLKPATFYLIDPLKKQFTARGVFDKTWLENLVRSNDFGEYGSAQSIFEFAAGSLISLIHAEESTDATLLKTCMFANIVNFARSKTASIALNADSDFRHFGAICYINPLRINTAVASTLRPIAICDPAPIVSSRNLFETIEQYVKSDSESHPEYFEGLDLHLTMLKLRTSFS